MQQQSCNLAGEPTPRRLRQFGSGNDAPFVPATGQTILQSEDGKILTDENGNAVAEN